MADTRALFTQRFDAARAALSAGDELAAAESLHAAIVAARSDPMLRRELASALFHLGKLSRKFGRAGDAEAETLLTEALAVSEEVFGREHAALAPVLNELARLHVHRSQHARAEEVLERLLAVTRSKGEENADVATALAGLAVVKRKLGDDASAEALFRDALRIREKVLEPRHMVTVVTLEQLSETCVARGNLAEALALLRRALATREVALGPGHATVQAARSRVTELELQEAVASDAAAAAVKAARAAEATPARPKRVPESPLSRERAKTPTVTAVVAAASIMASSIQTPSASQIDISPLGGVTGRESGAPHQRIVLADLARSDVATDDAALGELRSTIAPVKTDSPESPRNKRTVLYLSAGVASVAIALAAILMLRPHRGAGRDPASTTVSATQRNAAPGAPAKSASATGSVATSAATMMVAAGAESVHSANAMSPPVAPVVKPEEQKAPASDSLRLPSVKVRLAPINVPSISDVRIPAAPNADSMARSAAEAQRVSDTDRSRPTVVAGDNEVTPAKIIGSAPAPRFPDALLRSGHHDGEVVVRFIVNERGTVDVASMIVEQSDNELFTAAVRDILPRFRFEPARTHAPDSKPVASWVSVPFRFTTKK